MKMSRSNTGCISGVIGRGVVLAFVCSAAVTYAGEPIPALREDIAPVVSGTATFSNTSRGHEVVMHASKREIMTSASTPAQSILAIHQDDEPTVYSVNEEEAFSYNRDARAEMERKHAERSEQFAYSRYYRDKHIYHQYVHAYDYAPRCSYYYNNCGAYYYPDGYWPQSSLQWSLGLGWLGSSHYHHHGHWGYGVGVSQVYRYPYY